MEIKRDVENAKLLDNFPRSITKYMSIPENRFTRDTDLIGVSSNEPNAYTGDWPVIEASHVDNKYRAMHSYVRRQALRLGENFPGASVPQYHRP